MENRDQNFAQTENTAAPVAEAPKRRGRPPKDPNAPVLPLRDRLIQAAQKIAEKIKALQEDYTEIFERIQQIDNPVVLDPGTAVLVTVGRGDKATEVQGVILASKTEEDGTVMLKVQYGSGFDADIIAVKSTKVKAVTTAATPA